MRLLVIPALAVATCAAVWAPAAHAAVDMNEEDYRLYCGYLDALGKPDIQKLKGDDAREKKIATMAKVKPAVLHGSVDKGTKAGATCDEIGKQVASDAKRGLDSALPKRITFFDLDYSDPNHVVARVSWLGIDKKKLDQEASLVAFVLASEAPIVKTIAIRAVDPTAADKTADDASWFDAKISRDKAAHIQKDKIADYAETRYSKLFDGVTRK
jgi:hypothetical protein